MVQVLEYSEGRFSFFGYHVPELSNLQLPSSILKPCADPLTDRLRGFPFMVIRRYHSKIRSKLLPIHLKPIRILYLRIGLRLTKKLVSGKMVAMSALYPSTCTYPVTPESECKNNFSSGIVWQSQLRVHK